MIDNRKQKMLDEGEYRDQCHLGRRYLTNMPTCEIDLVAEAIQKSGRQDIHIDPDPVPGTPNFLSNQNYFSIWVESLCDCSDFWRTYDELRALPRWQCWLTLCKSG